MRLHTCKTIPSLAMIACGMFTALRISYFDVGNIIHLLESKWRQDVHEGKPMCCEGVLCNSRLQVLAHTIAHETVSYGRSVFGKSWLPCTGSILPVRSDLCT